MQKVLVHYFEIGLKGGNRSYFEKKLVENIKASSIYHKVNLKNVVIEHKNILCLFDDSNENIAKALKHIFGISSFSYVTEVEKDIDKMSGIVGDLLKSFRDKGISKIAFGTKRADKNFHLKSPQINERYGDISKKIGLKVDYKNATSVIFTEVMQKKVYIYTEKINCYRGLPVSSSGRVLALLSGGIDSPVAAWKIMRRGCSVDFLHVHTFRTNKEDLKSKISEIIKLLNKYQFKSKIYLLPYSAYEVFVSGNIPDKYELVFFKHFLLKVGESIVLKNNYDSLVTGDNLGQVASQTIENIRASQFGIKIPVFMPLLTFDKQEIIKCAQDIGTYELSIRYYKDCCSLAAKHPATRTKLSDFENILKKIDLNAFIEKIAREIEVFEIS